LLCDILAALALVSILPKKFIYSAFAISAALSICIVSYAHNFKSPLFLTAIKTQWSECSALGSDILSFIPLAPVASILIAFAFKFIFTTFISFEKSQNTKVIGAIFLCTLLAVHTWQNAYKNPIKDAFADQNYYNPVKFYGYLITWVSEALLVDEAALLATFDESPLSNKITKKDGPIAPNTNLSVIQVESLDYDVVFKNAPDGTPVTPFLRKLFEENRHYKIDGPHIVGSGSSDFMMLMQRKRSTQIMAYMLKSYNFTQKCSLPNIANRLGYETVAIHGYEGEYFRRKSAFNKMGIDHVIFYEDVPKRQYKGYPFFKEHALLDEDVFDISIKKLQNAKEKQFHFIITVTSHGPFNYLPTEKREIFAEPKNGIQAYFNSMRYIDRCLEKYANSAKETTVIIYGDHSSGLKYTETPSHCVPFIIAGSQCTPLKPTPSTIYSLEDAASCVKTFFTKKQMEEEHASL
jgi:phosphoglycerol transferase MdoB-like AlkP superfamily enzyme